MTSGTMWFVDQLSVRLATRDDLPDFAAMLADQQVAKWLWFGPNSPEETETFFGALLDAQAGHEYPVPGQVDLASNGKSPVRLKTNGPFSECRYPVLHTQTGWFVNTGLIDSYEKTGCPALSGSSSRSAAIASITRSIAIMPWGPPKPRNAVFETVLVRQR